MNRYMLEKVNQEMANNSNYNDGDNEITIINLMDEIGELLYEAREKWEFCQAFYNEASKEDTEFEELWNKVCKEYPGGEKVASADWDYYLSMLGEYRD